MANSLRTGLALVAGIFAIVIGLCGCSAVATPTPTTNDTSSPSVSTGPASPDPESTTPASTAAGCPAHPLSIGASTGSQVGVVLAFEPTSALVCRYSGLPGSGTLVGSANVRSPGQLSQLRLQVDVITRIRAGQVYHCPNDTGAVIDAHFSNSIEHLDLQFHESGCQFVTSSAGSYRAPRSSTLLAQLKSLTT